MKTTNSTAANGNSKAILGRPGCALIALGGAGQESAASALKQHRAAGCPFPMGVLAIDTDPTDLGRFDRWVNIAPTREIVSAMSRNPGLYGPACQAVTRHHPYLLEYETLGMGARTIRLLTQVAFELFANQITQALRSAIHDLLRQGQFDRILPVVVASTGGGTGSAGLILLLDYFMDPKKKKRILLGLSPDLVSKPVAFVIDPFSHAIGQQNEVAPEWILANAYATRVELAEYEKAGRGYYLTCHLGLGNDSGAVFSTIQQVTEANGLRAWEWMANYPQFKGMAVNQLDFYMETCRYQAPDIPESVFPPEEQPPYACRK